MSDTRRRVKVYTLNEDRQWDDRGTGHVSSTYVEELKGMSLLVRAESDGSLLLESKINPNTAYQKQQVTTILKLMCIISVHAFKLFLHMYVSINNM
ncbi:protein phosphatase 4 regulatory subunit 3B [Phyllostomus discolor]|uniref:Protein phosphatase 4 regulatory subunit 3B n=1 Tax=Phyllostomus discolor TaxID=89673 RepID=A0A834A701_9CHIR|nr:protein phosphatase 4 regulatory subunit 3B [Phyllostomus discolor]